MYTSYRYKCNSSHYKAHSGPFVCVSSTSAHVELTPTFMHFTLAVVGEMKNMLQLNNNIPGASHDDPNDDYIYEQSGLNPDFRKYLNKNN